MVGAMNTVIIPATPMERLLIAPSISPISKAFVVPNAWDDVPMATPMATSFFILNTLHTIGAITAPIIPVINIANTVIGIIPPNWLDISIPIGVVTDLGKREDIISPFKSNIMQDIIIDITPITVPKKIPTTIGTAYLFKLSN